MSQPAHMHWYTWYPSYQTPTCAVAGKARRPESMVSSSCLNCSRLNSVSSSRVCSVSIAGLLLLPPLNSLRTAPTCLPIHLGTSHQVHQRCHNVRAGTGRCPQHVIPSSFPCHVLRL